MWSNWAGDQRCVPARRIAPTSVEEVAATVRAAADRGEVVRVVGAGHAFGDNVVTDGTLISLDGLTGLHHVDRAAGTARIAAGTRLYDVNRLLDAHGLALANLGDINVQSAAGAISTATHGTGSRLGNLATLVESLEIVTADGSVVEVDGDDLRAARVSVGALGVVTAYTLRTVPAFRLRERRERLPLSDVIADLDAYADGSDHFEFFVFPHTRDVLAKSLDRTEEPAAGRSRAGAYVDEVLIENHLLGLVCRTGRRAPRMIPRLNGLVTRLASGSTRIGHSHQVFSSPRRVRFTETEWAFPREACADALTAILAVAERRGTHVNFPIEVRFVAADTDSMLSPSYGRDTAYIAAHMFQGMAWQEFFGAVEEVAADFGARPHWGKRHTLDAARLSELYPEFGAFQDARKRLDPDGVFANAHVRRIFG